MYFGMIMFTFVFATTDTIILKLRRHSKQIKVMRLEDARKQAEIEAAKAQTITRRNTMYKRKYLNRPLILYFFCRYGICFRLGAWLGYARHKKHCIFGH